ncbi:hypothetical protein [Parasitella parasitica]|uniref:Uncharacterized protein n=1 Tax=Parasitella parasitica TaxID=35722 RepID=A0A0B7NE23_9FUNG|nr:hypothetical protein [Parasitella parasitica]
MNQEQPSAGDLKDIQRQHQLDADKSQSNYNSSDSGASSSLLERRQSSRSSNAEESLGHISPMPTGAERMAALKNLGATFEEGQKSIAKVATPTETIVPSFVDSDHLEDLLQQKNNSNLADACNDTVAH